MEEAGEYITIWIFGFLLSFAAYQLYRARPHAPSLTQVAFALAQICGLRTTCDTKDCKRVGWRWDLRGRPNEGGGINLYCTQCDDAHTEHMNGQYEKHLLEKEIEKEFRTLRARRIAQQRLDEEDAKSTYRDKPGDIHGPFT